MVNDQGAPVPFFSFFRLHSHLCSVATPCRFGWPANVAATKETLHRSVERKFARQWRLLNSPVFRVLFRVPAWFVPQREGFVKFRYGGEDDAQAGEQFAAIYSKRSRAMDRPALQNIGSEVGLTKQSTNPAGIPELALFISGGIWATESIEQTPEVLLDSWQCFEVQLPKTLGKARHLAGRNARNGHGRVSSAIGAMDPATRTCTTQLERVYKLGERNGLTPDGEYTWRQWLHINQASDIVDVTDEIKTMLTRSA
jgi:hypothetical protein